MNSENRRRKHLKIRNKIFGMPDKPRLSVFRSAKHIYAQIIDDVAGRTLVSASSNEKNFSVGTGGNMKAAREVGRLIGKRAVEKGISQVVFDRGGYIYHGRVASVAEGARESSLKF